MDDRKIFLLIISQSTHFNNINYFTVDFFNDFLKHHSVGIWNLLFEHVCYYLYTYQVCTYVSMK